MVYNLFARLSHTYKLILNTAGRTNIVVKGLGVRSSEKQLFYRQKRYYSQSAWEAEGWDEEKLGLQQANFYTCICYDALLD